MQWKNRLGALLGAFCFIFCLPMGGAAQATYFPNRVIVNFADDATWQEKMATRNFFGILSYHPIGDGAIEVWDDLSFPLQPSITANALGSGLSPIESLEELIGILNTNNNGTTSNERVIINEGEYDYVLELPDALTPGTLIGSAPLYACPGSNDRLIGSPNHQNTAPVKIVIMDELITTNRYQSRLVETFAIADNLGGTHANAVTSVIHDILTQSQLQQYELYNVAVFDATGTASYSDLLRGFYALKANQITDAVINLSASVQSADSEYGQLIWQRIDQLLKANNLLLISSAGNEAYPGENVFPGCAKMDHELTVAGTDNCFTSLWPGSNRNSEHYEIGAEATDILVHDGFNYHLASGTSFAAPQVTAVAAQLASLSSEFNAMLIKYRILESADENPALTHAIQDGKILNASTSSPGLIGISTLRTERPANQLSPRKFSAAAARQLSVSPNPFHSGFQLKVQGLPAGIPVEVLLIDALGRAVEAPRTVVTDGFSLQLDWAFSEDLPAGFYYLRIETDSETITHQLIRR